jgi:arabinose-5-phosphate isomerase
VYEQAKKAIENVWVATDDHRIYNHVESFGGQAVLTSKGCRSGTERCATLARGLLLAADDIVVNIQGDEPLIDPRAIGDLIDAMKEGVEIATLIGGEETTTDPNRVKVLISPLSGYAAMFSRTLIEWDTNYKHIGVYAYRVETLLMLAEFSSITGLEQIAWMNAGCKIKCVQTSYESMSVDTPEDLIAVEQHIVRNQVAEVLIAERQAVINIPVSNMYATAIDIMYKRVHEQGGKLITTGMGKAGGVAKDLATTFASTGTPAVFLHPSEAQHGDLGIIQKNDVLLMISNSGQTREVMELFDLKSALYNIPTILITGHPESGFAQMIDCVIDTGNPKEVCPLDLTPTTSTTVMGVIGDVLVTLMMKRISFTKEEYAKRHHGGYIGKKLNDNT